MIPQRVARGFLAGLGRDPVTVAAQHESDRVAMLKPGAAIDRDDVDCSPSPHRDDATAAAVRRLLDLEGMGC